jgi:hypothetical protein
LNDPARRLSPPPLKDLDPQVLTITPVAAGVAGLVTVDLEEPFGDVQDGAGDVWLIVLRGEDHVFWG